MKRYAKEYWKLDKNKNKSKIEKSKANIIELTEKYSEKYSVDLYVSDTIFILETCSVESMICYGSLFTQKGRINLKYSNKLEFTSHHVFEEWMKNISILTRLCFVDFQLSAVFYRYYE